MGEAHPTQDLTRLLHDAGRGDRSAADRLVAVVYEQLRQIARQRMREQRGSHTLQATALVHEAFLRLAGGAPAQWSGRAHFFNAAAEAMRQILIDHARTRGRVKRGGGRRRVPLGVADLAVEPDRTEIVSLDQALRRLEECDPGIGEVVRLRFYAGLSIAQTAQTLGISPATVKRRWEFGRTWLYRELTNEDQKAP